VQGIGQGGGAEPSATEQASLPHVNQQAPLAVEKLVRERAEALKVGSDLGRSQAVACTILVLVPFSFFPFWPKKHPTVCGAMTSSFYRVL